MRQPVRFRYLPTSGRERERPQVALAPIEDNSASHLQASTMGVDKRKA